MAAIRRRQGGIAQIASIRACLGLEIKYAVSGPGAHWGHDRHATRLKLIEAERCENIFCVASGMHEASLRYTLYTI